MAGTGLTLREKVLSADKTAKKGLYVVIDGNSALNVPKDGGSFEYTTGGDGLADIPSVAGTYVIMPATEVVQGCSLDITSLRVANLGAGWSGGTAGTVSLTLQGTDGTPIATFTQTALSGTTGAVGSGTISSLSISPGSTLTTGVVDYAIRSIGASLPRGVGIVAVVANSNAGASIRLSLSGRYTTALPGA